MNKESLPADWAMMIACFIGMALMKEGSEAIKYAGVGLCCAGSLDKVCTIPGAVILLAGIFGTIVLEEPKAIMIAAAVLAVWHIQSYIVRHMRD